MAKIPRKLSLVKFKASSMRRGFRNKYPFRIDATYIFIGEIPNMPGHCVLADHQTGKLYSGYHTDNFVELSGNEL
jgi:hypothetical protein